MTTDLIPNVPYRAFGASYSKQPREEIEQFAREFMESRSTILCEFAELHSENSEQFMENPQNMCETGEHNPNINGKLGELPIVWDEKLRVAFVRIDNAPPMQEELI